MSTPKRDLPEIAALTSERLDTGSVKWDLDGSKHVLPLWVADMDFPVAQPILDALRKRLEHPVFGYGFVPESWYEAFRHWTFRRQNWKPGRADLLYATGMMPAIRELVLALTEPGDGIIVQPPVYYPFYSVVEEQQRTVLRNPLEYDNLSRRYTIDFQGFEDLAARPTTKAAIICSPHNPVGRIWSEVELRALVKIAELHSVYLIIDEIHCDILLGEARRNPDAAFFASGRIGSDWVLPLQAPGKTFNIPGLPSAVVAVQSPELRARVKRQFDRANFGIPNLASLVAAEAAYTSGDAWLEAVLDRIEKNFQLFDDCGRRLGLPFERVTTQATYLAWVHAGKFLETAGLTSDTFQRRLLKDQKVWLSSGQQFGIPEGSGWLRLNLACAPETLSEALQRIRTWIDEYER